jgi:hypothetical protein
MQQSRGTLRAQWELYVHRPVDDSRYLEVLTHDDVTMQKIIMG